MFAEDIMLEWLSFNYESHARHACEDETCPDVSLSGMGLKKKHPSKA